MVKISTEWKKVLKAEFEKPYFAELTEKVRNEYLQETVFPQETKLFRAFELVEPEDVRVVILGQDPYHTPGVADGLAFSTQSTNKVPPSLQNIFKELRAEGFDTKDDPDLTRWATQGVLLLNASLSVRSGEANSHADYGWHQFTDAVIHAISEREKHVVFMLWGNYAKGKQPLIDGARHLLLTGVHPSPLSAHRGFFGSTHFRLANEYLKANGRKGIDWH